VCACALSVSVQLMRELPYFTVVERDGCIIACAALFPFAAEQTAEVAAFAVSPVARGHGQGTTCWVSLWAHSVVPKTLL